MGTFYIARERYDIVSFDFSGIPKTQIEGDIEQHVKVQFMVELREDLSGTLRQALQSPIGFDAEFAHGEYYFKVRDARLLEPLAERDYGNHRLRIVFDCERQSVLRMERPMGQQPIDKYDLWQRQLHTIHQDHQLVRRRRMELDRAYADLDEHKTALAKFEDDVQGRKAALFERGEPDWVDAAVKRWV